MTLGAPPPPTMPLDVFHLECGHSVMVVSSPETAPETGLWTTQQPSYVDSRYVMTCPVHATDEPAIVAGGRVLAAAGRRVAVGKGGRGSLS
jgi:hypothetical protein